MRVALHALGKPLVASVSVVLRAMLREMIRSRLVRTAFLTLMLLAVYFAILRVGLSG